MKKKIMMVAVLLGTLTLGACVDDNESQSVTDVRSAKAEQLRAMATLDKAKAEAELIYANAEKALAEAQVEYQKAQTAATQQETEEAKAKFAIEIERIKAETETLIAEAKLKAAKDQQELLDLTDERLRTLYAEYRAALGNIGYSQREKINLLTNISQAEAGLIPTKTLAENEVARLQKDIDMENYKIGLYNEYKGANLVDLKQKAEKAKLVAEAANDVWTKKNVMKIEAQNAYSAESGRFNMWSSVTNPIKTVAAAKELEKMFWSLITFNNKELSASRTISYYTLNASGVERNKQNLESGVKYFTDHIGTDKDDDTKYTLYGQIASLTKQKAAALAADPAADVSYYEGMIAQLNADIKTANDNLAAAKADLTKFNSLIASFAGDDLKAYDAAVAELTKLAVASEKADTEAIDAQTAYNKANNEYNVANQLIYQTDVERLISDCQSNIARLQQSQQYYKNGVTSGETLIVGYKADLENITGQIVAQQAIIDNLKKKIDAAIAGQE